MNIYLLERADGGWDEAQGFVVLAETPDDARRLASERPGNEGPLPWLDGADTTPKKIGESHLARPQIALRDFLYA